MKLFKQVGPNTFKLVLITENNVDDYSEQAYDEGAKARENNFPIDSNPYNRSNYAHNVRMKLAFSWETGWKYMDDSIKSDEENPYGE